jgi:hypothetical protein
MKLTTKGKPDRRSITSALNGKKFGGRRKGEATVAAEKARAYIAKRVEKELEPIVNKAIELAKVGDRHSREWLSNYAWGKPTTIIVTEDENGNRKEISGNAIVFEKQNGD